MRNRDIPAQEMIRLAEAYYLVNEAIDALEKCDRCAGRGWYWTGSSTFRIADCADCGGSGKEGRNHD